jgi:UDP-N-acetylglucosamine--N-acetylmuramyl-(pentapeptide) pyrophosphoryl-undecaprenol N-acetylglucosamine transferase
VQKPLKVMIAGGGTGGHVIPALAIGRELRDRYGAEVRFVGTARGLETRLVPEAGFPLELVRSGQLKGVSLATRVRTLFDLPVGILRCVGLLRQFKVDVVVGVGGYASGPAMIAAVLMRVPTLAFEPNAVPGLANRVVGKWVAAAAVNFVETKAYFRNAKVTGIPVRAEFFAVEPKMNGPMRLLVFGGSQGARVLNDVIVGVAGGLLEAEPGLEIVHQVGGRHEGSAAAAYAAAGLTGRVRVVPYLDGMVEEFAAADLMLCRSGASTVAELAAAGKASVLVPFAAAADDHQRKNADAFVAVGAAVMVTERELSGQRLVEVLKGLLGDKARLHEMGARARGLAHRDAVEKIAGMVVGLARIEEEKRQG